MPTPFLLTKPSWWRSMTLKGLPRPLMRLSHLPGDQVTGTRGNGRLKFELGGFGGTNPLTKRQSQIGCGGDLRTIPFLIGERRIGPGFFSGLRPFRAAWRNPSFSRCRYSTSTTMLGRAASTLMRQRRYVSPAGLNPLWRCIGQFVETIMQDRRHREWGRFAMRGLESPQG